jgi:hypothetical protein
MADKNIMAFAGPGDIILVLWILGGPGMARQENHIEVVG